MIRIKPAAFVGDGVNDALAAYAAHGVRQNLLFSMVYNVGAMLASRVRVLANASRLTVFRPG